MRKATKVLFFIMGLVVIIYSGFTFYLMYNYMYLDPSWAMNLGLTQMAFMAGFYATCVFAALTALVGLVMIVRSLSAKRRDYKLSFSDESGSVEISEDAILNSVRATIAEYQKIVESDVRVDLNNKTGHISCKANCGIREGVNLDQYGQSLKERITKNLVGLTGMTVDDVTVTFYDATPHDQVTTGR